MKRGLLLAGATALLCLGAWQASSAIQNVVKPVAPKAASAAPTTAAKPDAASLTPKPAAAAPTGKSTPMEQRVATLGLLNKRNGLWRDITLKPGGAVRIGDVVVRLKACETTPPWEDEQLTGAFVQVIVRGPDTKWRKEFSGWLYKETPSLNMVEHPIYDVWTKACQMRHPDTGPGTIIAKGGGDASGGSSAPRHRSSAPRSPAPEPAAAPDTADDSNDI